MDPVNLELTRAFMAVGVEIIGKKKSRKMLRAMQGWILMQPPAQIGPVPEVRLVAVRVLATTLVALDGPDP